MSDELTRALGKRISKARRAKGWKQKHLAAVLGVEPVTISRWETGAHTPPVTRLFEIAKVLGIEPGELVSDELAAADGATR